MNNSYDIQNGRTDQKKETCWARKSRLEKRLIIFSVVFFIVVIVLVTILAVFLTRPHTTCLSSSCIQTANELLEYMDPDVNPCDDFYQFACGNFIDNVVLEDNESKNVDNLLAKNVYIRARKILEEPQNVYHEPKPLQLAKKLYKACMNESAIEEKGLRLMKDSLNKIGGWPVLEGGSWALEKFDWKLATYKLREMGFGFEFFIALQIGIDRIDPTKYTIEIRNPYSPLHMIEDGGENYFNSYMVNVSVAFGADRNRANSEFRDVLNFKRSLFLAEDYDDKFEVLTISELKNKFFDIPWVEYLNRMLHPSAGVSYQQFVTLYSPKYFARLQNALRRTPKRVIANYISWRTVRTVREYLPKSISNIKWMYYIKGEENPKRPRTCFRIAYDHFALTIDSVYAKKYLSKEIKQDATEILENIKTEFKDMITETDWIDAETTAKASEKVSATTNHVAYAEELMDSNKIDQQYIGAQVTEDDFLASILNLKLHAANDEFKKLHEPVKNELHDGFVLSASVNYNHDDDSIAVYGRVLESIMYAEDRQKYLNYGGLGSVIGHEVFHIVFNLSDNPDEEKTENMLSADTRLALYEKLSCVSMHYGKYPVPEIEEHLNSSNTKFEDLADIIGTKLAYDAYNRWENENGPEQKLPGFDYTPRQLFWISSAVRFCGKLTADSLRFKLAHSIQSPKKYRVLGILRNLEEFSRDFNCPANSYMNTDDKCDIL